VSDILYRICLERYGWDGLGIYFGIVCLVLGSSSTERIRSDMDARLGLRDVYRICIGTSFRVLFSPSVSIDVFAHGIYYAALRPSTFQADRRTLNDMNILRSMFMLAFLCLFRGRSVAI